MRYLSSHSESGLGWVKQNVSLMFHLSKEGNVNRSIFYNMQKRKQKFNQVLVLSLKSSTYQGSCEWYGLSNKAVHSLSRVLSYLVNHECVHRI